MVGGVALFFPFELDSSVLVALNAMGLLIGLTAFLPEIWIILRRWGLMKTAVDPNAKE